MNPPAFRIINQKKPGALWRLMLQMRVTAKMFMGSNMARIHIKNRCAVMRQEHNRQVKLSLMPSDDRFVDILSARQGW